MSWESLIRDKRTKTQIGLEVIGGRVVREISQDTELPCSVTSTYQTSKDWQTSVSKNVSSF